MLPVGTQRAMPFSKKAALCAVAVLVRCLRLGIKDFDAERQYSSPCRLQASLTRSAAGMRTLFVAMPQNKIEPSLMHHHQKQKAPEWVPFWWWSIKDCRTAVAIYKTKPRLPEFARRTRKARLAFTMLDKMRLYGVCRSGGSRLSSDHQKNKRHPKAYLR